MKIIINADDFGLNSEVNHAIIKSFLDGVVNSTTIMANMPGFEEAVELSNKFGFTDKIGVHLNLDEGSYVKSENLQKELFFLRKISKNRNRLFYIPKKLKNMIYEEFVAQIEKVRKKGLRITHLDTHHHIHEILPILKMIFVLLKRYNIPAVRIINNLNKNTQFIKKTYRNYLNNRIIKSGFNFTEYFGNQIESIAFLKGISNSFGHEKLEIMVHPVYNKKGELVDKINDNEISFDIVKEFIKLRGMRFLA